MKRSTLLPALAATIMATLNFASIASAWQRELDTVAVEINGRAEYIYQDLESAYPALPKNPNGAIAVKGLDCVSLATYAEVECTVESATQPGKYAKISGKAAQDLQFSLAIVTKKTFSKEWLARNGKLTIVVTSIESSPRNATLRFAAQSY